MLILRQADGEKQRRLFEIIKAVSFSRDGAGFTLASGSQSGYYFDMKPTLLLPEGASLVADLVYQLVADEDVKYVGGLASGAVPIVSVVVQRSATTNQPVSGFYVRAEVKDHGLLKLVEGNIEDGARVVILDDVTTAGGSVMKAVRAVQETHHCRVVKIISIVDREESAVERFRQEGIKFVSLFTTSDFR